MMPGKDMYQYTDFFITFKCYKLMNNSPSASLNFTFPSLANHPRAKFKSFSASFVAFLTAFTFNSPSSSADQIRPALFPIFSDNIIVWFVKLYFVNLLVQIYEIYVIKHINRAIYYIRIQFNLN